MADIRTIGALFPLFSQQPAARAAAGSETAEPGVAVEDRIEISEQAQSLAQKSGGVPVRADKVAEIRAALARGDYLTPEKLETALQRALEDVDRLTGPSAVN